MDANGVTRTGLQGFLYFITPHVEGFDRRAVFADSARRDESAVLLFERVDGHHDHLRLVCKKDVNLGKSVNQIELFDTLVALLAGVMIIPAVYVFSGVEGMGAGPSLMFVSLPKVFDAMGKAGTFVGALFFLTAILRR